MVHGQGRPGRDMPARPCFRGPRGLNCSSASLSVAGGWLACWHRDSRAEVLLFGKLARRGVAWRGVAWHVGSWLLCRTPVWRTLQAAEGLGQGGHTAVGLAGLSL